MPHIHYFYLYVFVLVCDSIGILKLGALLWNTGARKFHIVFHGLLCGCCLNGFTSVEGAFCVFHWIGKRKGPWGRTSSQQYCMQCSLLACSLTSRAGEFDTSKLGSQYLHLFSCGLCDWNVYCNWLFLLLMEEIRLTDVKISENNVTNYLSTFSHHSQNMVEFQSWPMLQISFPNPRWLFRISSNSSSHRFVPGFGLVQPRKDAIWKMRWLILHTFAHLGVDGILPWKESQIWTERERERPFHLYMKMIEM